jgi:hypothetical protein
MERFFDAASGAVNSTIAPKNAPEASPFCLQQKQNDKGYRKDDLDNL